MIIWVLDYQTGDCIKVNVAVEKKNRYSISDLEVHEWLSEHQEEIGIRLSECHWMVSDCGQLIEKDFIIT